MTDCDVLIVGAGPAGSAAARLLAAWGHHVIVVDKPSSEAGRLAESIPPSAQKVLAAIGALPAIEDAGFVRWRGNTVWWADEHPRLESFPPGTAGYQVSRHAFDDVLRRLAREAGAHVRTGLVREASVPGLARASSGDAGAPVQVVVEVAGDVDRLAAPFVLDCSGRAGVVARQGLRRTTGAARTIALTAIWRARGSWPVEDDTHTLVASYQDGWAWSVPTAPGLRHFTVMVDPARTGLARGRASVEIYLAELAKVGPFAAVLEAGALVEGPFGADASLYHADRYAGPGFLLVGDAGSSIDPLSSFGVKKALASGWAAAIVVHTALLRPELRDEALAFFDRRERDVHATSLRQAAQLATDVAARTPHAFWLARAESADGVEGGEVDVSALARDPVVVAAFEDLRARPSIQLRTVGATRVGPRAAIRGREIVLEDHLFLPIWPDGIRYLRDVDLVALRAAAPAHTDVGDFYRAFADTHPNVALPDFLGALSVLLATGVLVHAERPLGSC